LHSAAVLLNIGQPAINQPFEEIINQIEENGFEILPIVFEHTFSF